MSFDSAQKASSVLGCEGDELHTAVFKHHLRQLLQRATTGGSRERSSAAAAEEGERHLISISFKILLDKKSVVTSFVASLCRSQIDSGSVSGRNGCWAL